MISPDDVRAAAEKKYYKNIKFRKYLKTHADPDKLDKQFMDLHNELFDGYDCSMCRNCCKEYHGSIPMNDIEKDANYLGISSDDFIKKYLQWNEIGNCYETKHKPCDFMMSNGECALGECKPEGCNNYPYTNQPERLYSLYSVLDAIEVCPVAYEIFERLKTEYNFR